MTAIAPPSEKTRPDARPALRRGPASPLVREAPPASQRRPRKDLQGLRAVAVIAVVGEHATSHPSGGFLGVDVFFVISGFLITGLLLREFQQTGRIDLMRFYVRRVKRTLPVAWVVLVATFAAGFLVLSRFDLPRLVDDLLSAGTFWSNWHFIAIGTDYFHAGDLRSALQHYWSLAVEEQFYLVWPVLLIGMLLLAARSRLRWIPIAVLALLAGASLVWAAVQTSSVPTAAYFSTLTRAWELLAGAALAFARPLLERLPTTARPWLAWGGVAVLGVAFLMVDPGSPFPFPWALSGVLGAVLIIAAGSGHQDTRIWPLTNRVSGYIGTISYSIYLWHFPVIVFSEALHPGGGKALHLAQLVLTILLSMLSYHLIEAPLRTASWRRPRLPRVSRRQLLAAAAGVAACAVLITTLVVTHFAPPAVPVGVSHYVPAQEDGVLAARSSQVRAALGATSWPVLRPDDAHLGNEALPEEWTVDQCLHDFGSPSETTSRCVFGDALATRTAVVYGDSTALSWVPAVRKALAGQGWRIEVLTAAECPAMDIAALHGDGAPNPECDDYRRYATTQIARERPDLVLLGSAFHSIVRLASGQHGPEAAAAWTSASKRTVERLAAVADRVVVLDPPPGERAPRSCKTALSSPRDCVAGVDEDWKLITDAQHAGVEAAGRPNVSYPSTLPWFCDRRGLCPSFVDGVVTSVDGIHMSAAASKALAPLMREALLPGADVLRRSAA